MLGHIGLDRPRPGCVAAGAAGHLIEKLEGALGGAQVAVREAEIGVDHADQRQLREVVALGDELGADDDIDLAVLDRARSGLAAIAAAGDSRSTTARGALRESAPRPPRRCARCRGRTARSECSAPHSGRPRGSARRCRNGGIPAAAEAVLDQPGRAVRAFEAMAAGPAERQRRIAAAVQEQQRLLAARRASRRPPRTSGGESQRAALGRARAHVDRPRCRAGGARRSAAASRKWR